jgi:hypothetical protein
MSKKDRAEAELERQSIFTSAKNRVSKIGTGVKSAAEYGLVDGVGKTIKNFASGVSSGAKQGYGYFTTDRNMHTSMTDAFNKLEQLAPISAESQKNYYQALEFKDKFSYLTIECYSKYNTLKNDNEKSKLLSDLEEIVKNQIKDFSVLTLDNKYSKSLTQKEYTELFPQDKLNRLMDISKEIFNKMHDERAKQPEFIATTRKIEQYKTDLDNIELPNLAGAAGISKDEAYKNAQTYEEKINLIRMKLEADKKKSIPQSHINDSKSKIQNCATEDQQLTNTPFEDIKKTVADLARARTNSSNEQFPIETHLKRLETAKQTLAELRTAEEQLLKPKQNRVVRTLKTAAGLMAGATIGALRGSGSAIKTAAKAFTKAPSGIKETYRKNKSEKQRTR